MKTAIAAILCLVGGCAQTVWVKPGASAQDFYRDHGQCNAQAFSVPGASLMQVAIVQNACLQGKGWYTQRAQ
jgi:malonyl CoA-acyl carrier protein transacylase